MSFFSWNSLFQSLTPHSRYVFQDLLLSATSAPSTLSPVSKRTDKLYKLPKTFSHLLTNPKADPAVAAPYNTSLAELLAKSVPDNKEKTFEAFWKQFIFSVL